MIFSFQNTLHMSFLLVAITNIFFKDNVSASDGVFTSQEMLTSPNPSTNGLFGSKVSIEKKYVAVTEINCNTYGTSCVRIYYYDQTWQLIQELSSPTSTSNSVNNTYYFGDQLKIYNDYLVISDVYDYLYIYQLDYSSNTFNTKYDPFSKGTSFDISDDYIIICNSNGTSNSCNVYNYTGPNANDVVDTIYNDDMYFGSSVSISSDSVLIAVGAASSGDDIFFNGSATLYCINNNTIDVMYFMCEELIPKKWQLDNDFNFQRAESIPGSGYGTGVSVIKTNLEDNRYWVAVTAPYFNNNKGVVHYWEFFDYNYPEISGGGIEGLGSRNVTNDMYYGINIAGNGNYFIVANKLGSVLMEDRGGPTIIYWVDTDPIDISNGCSVDVKSINDSFTITVVGNSYYNGNEGAVYIYASYNITGVETVEANIETTSLDSEDSEDSENMSTTEETPESGSSTIKIDGVTGAACIINFVISVITIDVILF